MIIEYRNWSQVLVVVCALSLGLEAHKASAQVAADPNDAKLAQRPPQRGVPSRNESAFYASSVNTDKSNHSFNHNQQYNHHVRTISKCTRQSVALARQLLAYELNQLNSVAAIWFNDLDKEELIEGQRHSLSNIVMSGLGTRLLHSGGQPLIELESSYFRAAPAATAAHTQQPTFGLISGITQPVTSHSAGGQIALKLVRRHLDRCYLNADKGQFTIVLALAVGPVTHNLDVVYNLPKELSLSQPLDWRYGQVSINVPKMVYELTLKQAADYRLNEARCPLEVADLVYLPSSGGNNNVENVDSGASMSARGLSVLTLTNSLGGTSVNRPKMSVSSVGLALNNQTLLQLERLFDDYTRPTISRRLKQILKFHLNTKSIPLEAATSVAASNMSRDVNN